MPDDKQAVSRKWKLTLWMIALYTIIYGVAYVTVSIFLVKSIVPDEVWRTSTASYLAMWSYAVFAVSGWYLGMNVIQKWSPFPGSGMSK